MPKNNTLHQINELIDLSFVSKELQDTRYLDNVHNIDPTIAIFKYQLLKSTFSMSDIDVVEHSKYDMSFKDFLNMAPGGPVIPLRNFTSYVLRSRLLNILIQKQLISMV